jgi:hypothetical protein
MGIWELIGGRERLFLLPGGLFALIQFIHGIAESKRTDAPFYAPFQILSGRLAA